MALSIVTNPVGSVSKGCVIHCRNRTNKWWTLISVWEKAVTSWAILIITWSLWLFYEIVRLFDCPIFIDLKQEPNSRAAVPDTISRRSPIWTMRLVGLYFRGKWLVRVSSSICIQCQITYNRNWVSLDDSTVCWRHCTIVLAYDDRLLTIAIGLSLDESSVSCRVYIIVLTYTDRFTTMVNGFSLDDSSIVLVSVHVHWLISSIELTAISSVYCSW